MGLAGVASRNISKGERQLARESGATWDRLPMWWHEIQVSDSQLHPEVYDDVLAREPLTYVLAVLTSRYPRAVDLDAACVRAVRAARKTGTLPPEQYGDGKYGFCVTYKGYDYDYGSNSFRHCEPPLLEDGTPNPANPWAVFVYTTTQYYRDRVHAWEIFNEIEPGFESGWDPDEGNTPITITYLPPPEVYAALIRDAIVILQQTNPGDPIVLGSPLTEDAWALAKGSDGSDRSWYNKVLQELRWALLSALGLHSYGEPRLSYELITRLQHKTPFPFWLTETGLHVGQTDWNGNCPSELPCGSEEEQAAYVVQQYAWALRAFQETGRPGKVFHFAFKDLDLPWGLLQGSEPRASYYAFQFIVRLLNHAAFDSFEKRERYVRMTFVKSGGRISLLWATKKATEPVLAAVPASTPGAKAILYSQTGAMIRSVTAAEGNFVIYLPPPTHPKGTGIDLKDTTSGDPNDCMIGGPVFILVETTASAPPTGSASVICQNGRAVGTDLWAY
ncbi:MAG: hypothetical protein ACPL7C_11025, partial [Anaerolineae bacterium]